MVSFPETSTAALFGFPQRLPNFGTVFVQDSSLFLFFALCSSGVFIAMRRNDHTQNPITGTTNCS